MIGLSILLAAVGGPAPPGFQNVAEAAGIADRPAVRVVWGDLNGDGWLDCILDGAEVCLSFPDLDDPTQRIFHEVTETAGVWKPFSRDGVRRKPQIVVLGDVDNDGDLDIFAGWVADYERWKADPASKEGAPLLDSGGNPVPAVPDEGIRSRILLNDGDARFTPVPNSGVGEPPGTTWSATFLDYDLDGILDLYVGNWYRNYGWDLECYSDRLYRGRGDGTFADVTEEAGILTKREPGDPDSAGPTFGVTHTDWNNDGWPDILVCTYGRQWNVLWRNNGDGTFTNVAAETHFDGDEIRHGRYPDAVKKQMDRRDELPFRANGNTFDAACADYDNDGDIDIFLGEITHWWAGDSSDLSMLLVNEGPEKAYGFRRDPGAVKRVHTVAAWNQGDMHVGWLDYDNDGLLDLLIGSSDYPDSQMLKLYRQSSDHAFEEITGAVGLDWEGCGGISLGDYDRDGDVDILAGKSVKRLPAERRPKVAAPGLFRNETDAGNRWLTVKLIGRGRGGANRGAVGARVSVTAGGVTQTREVTSGAGHAGHQNAPECCFGLGRSRTVGRVVVLWPDRAHTTTELKDVAANRVLIIEQEQPEESGRE